MKVEEYFPMKRLLKTRLIALILFCCISLSLSTTAFASYSYNPLLRTISPEEFVETVAEHLGVPADVDTLVEMDILNTDDCSDMRIWEGVSLPIAARVLLSLYDVTIYPAEFFGDLYVPSVCYFATNKQNNLDAASTAIAYGIVNPTLVNTRNITEETLLGMIEKLENETYAALIPMPCIDNIIADVGGECSCDCEDYDYRRSVLIGVNNLPHEWVEDFYKSGWRIKKGLKKGYVGNAVGLTVYDEKAIYLKDYGGDWGNFVVAHEFVHFVCMQLKWDKYWSDYLQRFYREGKKSQDHILRDYAWTDQNEYIAEYVATWILYPDQQSTLSSYAPETAKVALRLIEDYAELVHR